MLIEAGQKRREALSNLLTRYLNSISAGTDSEDNSMIADARLDMRLARRFADRPSPAQRRTFLPLIAL